jgi:hypothetical protein
MLLGQKGGDSGMRNTDVEVLARNRTQVRATRPRVTKRQLFPEIFRYPNPIFLGNSIGAP